MQGNRIAEKIDTILFWALLGVLAWLPIPLGSNRGWSWSLMEMMILTLSVSWVIVHMLTRSPLPSVLRELRLPLVLLISWLLYHLIQIIPLPLSLLEILSPASIELRHYLLEERVPDSMTLSLDPGATLQDFLKATTYVLLFVLVLVLVNSRKRLRQLAMLLVYVGVIQAVFGLSNYFTEGQFGFFEPAARWGTATTGTYVNRNHFAGLLEMTIAIALGLILVKRQQEQFYPTFKSRLRAWMRFLLSNQSRLYLYALLMFAALILSTSRGGCGSLFIALFVGIVLFRWLGGIAASRARLGRLVGVLMLLSVAWFGFGNLSSKLVKHGLETDRILTYEATYSLIANYPLFGTGAGTFEWVFPLYKIPQLSNKIYDHVHNDFLELLADQGVFGFVLLGVSLLMIGLRIISGLKKRQDPLLRGILFGVICGLLSLLMHAATDFNLHIPANAAIFWCLLGMGVSSALIKRRGARCL